MDLISIIVPIYNAEKTLDRCLSALTKQSYENIDICLINDGSTDSSLQICYSYARIDSRIRVFQTNGGASCARNMGLTMAKGDYCVFCDSDDYPKFDWCEKLLLAQKQHIMSFTICNYYICGYSSCEVNREQLCANLPSRLSRKKIYKLYDYQLLATPWNKIYRSDIIRKNKLHFREDISLGEDLVFNLDYIESVSGDFFFINDPLYYYYVGSVESLTNRYYDFLDYYYNVIFERLKQSLINCDCYEEYEIGFSQSRFWAFERVLNNTFSQKCKKSLIEKITFNRNIYRSSEFKHVKKYIGRDNIGFLQYITLQTNSYFLFMIGTILSKFMTYIVHLVKRN